jgi:O-antigen/teichoic acid export membrane protein
MQFKIISKFRQHSLILQNFTYLSIIEILNLLLPFITLPYLIRLFGKDLYGLVAFAASLAAYFSILISFGFNISGTRLVSINRESRNKLSEIVSNILAIKLFLFLAGFIIYFLIIMLNSFLSKHYFFFMLSYLVCVSDILIPIWFYQGIEKMKYLTITHFISKIIFTALVFIIIGSKERYLFLPVLNFLGAVVGGCWAFSILFLKYKIELQKVTLSSMKEYLKDSVPFFTSRIAGTITTETNTLLIGSILTFKDVAYYDIAKKITNVLLIPFGLINNALFPSISRTKNMKLVKQIAYVVFLLGILVSILCVFFGNFILKIIGGPDLIAATSILLLMSLRIPVNGISYLFGTSVLVANGYSKEFNQSVIFEMIFYLSVTTIFIFSHIWTLYSSIFILIVCLLFETLYRYFYIKKYKIF